MINNCTRLVITTVGFLIFAFASQAQKKIVVLGSSTAAGSGASSYANAWVGKYASHVTSLNAGHTLVNLAVGGYNTYLIVPTDTPHPGRPGQDPLRNITAAVTTHDADIVIVNMPSNDVANSYDVSETLLNYRRIKFYCDSAGVVVYFTTTQPRNFTDAGKLGQLMQIRDSTLVQYGNRAIDFWSGIANPDGTIVPAYNADGIHVNDPAHEIFYQRVKAKPILSQQSPLPVLLENFKAQKGATGIKLDWALSTGTEKAEQEIQRAGDGISFMKAGSMPSSGSGIFTFTDTNPFHGKNYYRLKITTPSLVKYSPVLHISTGNESEGISIFPNPVVGRTFTVQVNQTQGGPSLFRIYNAGGYEVYRKMLKVQSGVSIVPVQMQYTLGKGLYFASVSAEGKSYQQTLVVQ